jgi:hypothetical protein
MPRHPLIETMTLTARVPRGEAGFWEIMLRLDAQHGAFSVPDVENESNVGAGAVAQFLRKLIRGGYARQVGTRPAPVRDCKLYKLVRRPKLAPRLDRDGAPVDDPARQRMWRCMRTLPLFTVDELAFAAQDSAHRPVPRGAAERYVHHLNAAGYLSVIGSTARTVAYKLKPGMNTGPLAPAVLRIDAVYDRNRRTLVSDGPLHAATEDAA